MATQAYYDWVADGRQFKLATPVAMYREALWGAGWSRADVGTLGNEAHLTATQPEDHCPFSRTGWPNPNPYPYVHALDLSGSSPAGMNFEDRGRQWIDDARSGRTPWVKYIIWQAKRYDVRNDWSPVPATGHYDHVHLSFRTDYTLNSIGTYQVTGGGIPMSTTPTGHDVWSERISSPSLGYDQPAGEWLKWVYANHGLLEILLNKTDQALAKLADVEGKVNKTVDPVALAQSLAANQQFIDTLAEAVRNELGEVLTSQQVQAVVSRIRLSVGAE